MSATSSSPDSSRLNFTDRAAGFQRVDGHRFDLIVIGAGITGAGIARDAAERGLSVLLVDAGDIACGTSSRSSKMIHGGLRYLAHGDVSLVREAASERQVLRVIAPHLARRCDFVIPGSRASTTKLRAGLAMFESLGKVSTAESHTVWNARELAINEPTLAGKRYSSAVVYPEFLTNDARLTLANVRSAAAAAAAVLTYSAVTRILVEHGRAVGVGVRGSLPGETFDAVARGSVIVNAAGPWVDAVRKLEDDRAPQRLTITKGIHVVVPRVRLPVNRTIVGAGADKRPVFAVPSGPVTYLGTTDSFYPRAETWPTIERPDVTYLFDFVSNTFDDPGLTTDDIVSMWAGARPLISQAGKSPSEISRKDEVWIGSAGIISIAGGKLTAYRTMAERVTDMVAETLGATVRPCSTATTPLVGGDVDVEAMKGLLRASVGDAGDRLVDLYGSEAAAVACRGGDLTAEIDHAIAAEGALTLTDYWVRRSARAWFTLEPVGGGLTQAASIMADRLGWSAGRRDGELAECTSHHTATFVNVISA